MGAVVSVLITAALGSWLAYLWQQRSLKATRYFDASKSRYDLMQSAANELASLIGKRLYAMQRLSLTKGGQDLVSLRTDLRDIIVEWNQRYLQIELNVRTLFDASTVTDLEHLQSSLKAITDQIFAHTTPEKSTYTISQELVSSIYILRRNYFAFLQTMIDEANDLFRRMHFGIRLQYESSTIDYFSTWQLVKAIFTGPEQASSVVRSPTDLGLPVDASYTRFGIYEH